MTIVRDQRYGPAEPNLLDVYVPTECSEIGKPVLLFVHGGGFFSGDKRWSDKVCFEGLWRAVSTKLTKLKYWANIGNWFAQQGIVVVVAGHQLVFYDKDETSSKEVESSVQYPAGADDIQLIREWIYHNISAKMFGEGSIDKVILFGHSSGGAHIAMNLYAAGE